MGYLKKERRYRITWHEGMRSGYTVLIHDTAYCWVVVEEVETRMHKTLYNCQKRAQELCDKWNDEDETLDPVVSENPGFVDS